MLHGPMLEFILGMLQKGDYLAMSQRLGDYLAISQRLGIDSVGP